MDFMWSKDGCGKLSIVIDSVILVYWAQTVKKDFQLGKDHRNN